MATIPSVSIDKAAELLGVSRRTIYNRIKAGRLWTIRTLGGSQRVTLESLYRLTPGRRGSPSGSSGSQPTSPDGP